MIYRYYLANILFHNISCILKINLNKINKNGTITVNSFFGFKNYTFLDSINWKYYDSDSELLNNLFENELITSATSMNSEQLLAYEIIKKEIKNENK